ncbi:hypothetical protein [Streptomyces marianii]|uniref:Uncharacterized protein n=1 Tax=Streptomyces marianii TaxID=1817406 RepID=A0A5R9E0Y4_9ACTN|nr:hypothetical protein [Streptomyces marianii]TLQ41994.1 hypothetical protein FEF34_00730 [Streptomyces marianii]
MQPRLQLIEAAVVEVGRSGQRDERRPRRFGLRREPAAADDRDPPSGGDEVAGELQDRPDVTGERGRGEHDGYGCHGEGFLGVG